MRGAKAVFLLLAAWWVAVPARPAFAQQLVKMEFEGRPSIYLGTPGRPAGCGVRVVGVEMLLLHPPLGRTVDASFMLDANGVATIKAVSQRMDPSALRDGKAPGIPVVAAWFRARGMERTAPLPGTSTEDPNDPSATLYTSGFKPTLAVLEAVDAGAEIQLAVQRRGEPMHTVYYGTVRLSDGDRTQLRGCAEELLAALKERPRGQQRTP